jgi:Txe/YoeB family toxin of Txe-Axe toxin-antitoxin module
MTLSFHENAWEDYLWWQQNSLEKNKQFLKRLNLLIIYSSKTLSATRTAELVNPKHSSMICKAFRHVALAMSIGWCIR